MECTNFDIDAYKWKNRVVLFYADNANEIPGKTIKKLEEHNYVVFMNRPGYQNLLNPKNPKGMIVVGLDGLVQYAGEFQKYGFIKNINYRDSK